MIQDTSTDVVVVGAGPAGMTAASCLAERGVRVLVLDENSTPGGQVYRDVEKVTNKRSADLTILGSGYRNGSKLVKRLYSSGAQYWPGTSVWEISAAEEPALAVGVVRDGRVRMIESGHIVLATGAMERATPFPGWTLPGVMTVGAAQSLLKSSGLVPNGRIAVAGSGPLLYLYASQLIKAGTKPEVILDMRPRASFQAKLSALAALTVDPGSMFQGLGWIREVRREVRVHDRVHRLCADGVDKLSSISYESCGRQLTDDVDLLLVHDGVIPNTWLAMSAGCRHHWHVQQRCWVPDITGVGQTSRQFVSVVGDAAGIIGADASVLHGEAVAGEVIACLAGEQAGTAPNPVQPLRDRQYRLLRRCLEQIYPPAKEFELPPDDDTIVCRCEEVTAGEIRRVAALGCSGPNQGKAFTRCGMGPCMGRKCGVTVSRLIAEHHGLGMDEVGHYRIRPPVKPISVGQLAELEIDANAHTA
jgi:NADPH-dependent 2,4-dienoyl-CoA reductase/sulfur reductase-like enzyme